MKTSGMDLFRRLAVRTLGPALRVARVGAYVAAVTIVVLLLASRSARSETGEKMLALGRNMSGMGRFVDGSHRVRINGESMFFGSNVIEGSVGQVLDQFQNHCMSAAGPLADPYEGLTPQEKKIAEQELPSALTRSMGTVRKETDTDGVVTCIAQEPGGGVRGLLSRLVAFAQTGDLGKIGKFRYAYARKTDSGKVQLMTSLTEGSFNVARVFGTDQEPAGEDPDGAPRPPGSKRLISAALEDMPYQTQVFITDQKRDELLDFYEAELPRLGWASLVGPGDLGMSIWQRQGVTMVLFAQQPESEGAPTMLSFVQARTTEPRVSP